MSWIKLDDALPSNRKIKDLSDRAFRLYVYGLCYCGRDLTDGIIDKDDERIIRATARASAKHVQELEDAGLWVRVNGHKVVNDYLKYNPTREKVESDREAARIRMQGRRGSGEGSKECSPEQTGELLLPSTSTRTSTRVSLTAELDFALERLLEVLTDADSETANVVAAIISGNRLAVGDVEWARECAAGPGVNSPSAVAVAELKKRVR
jgi:hypothetical protein